MAERNGDTCMMESVFIFSKELLSYRFGEQHPFDQKRLLLTKTLLEEVGALTNEEILPPRRATEAEIALIHDPQYIQAVQHASSGLLGDPEPYGLGTEDTPVFPNMHEASSWVVGGAITGMEAILSGQTKRALHLGGGLHHGFRGKASGFCVYNDTAVAIELAKRQGYRVLYVDTDAHHGDGVQWAFYDDPAVCTLSIHETGRYLFPGTGSLQERGHGNGYGFSFNIPLDAFTEDESWLHAYEEAFREVAHYFQPDIIVTQNGADAHFLDPLTHLCSTMKIYQRIPLLAKEIADMYCDGRWLAVGGGGYDHWRVVPRAWSYIWLAMKERDSPTDEIPKSWREMWQKEAPVTLPNNWDDGVHAYEPIPRKAEIDEKNEQTVKKALYICRSTSPFKKSQESSS
ncbi:acetoin utilization protein AcuC [Bacillus fonticola]|uniref:acetoin utilization protein AcuC n=1 Tax=Bacillus fonticola TaxID=2728853 RepID=UPI002AD3A7AF|nr:acetoin utilization protein AcuC [Bacillus fonticola]